MRNDDELLIIQFVNILLLYNTVRTYLVRLIRMLYTLHIVIENNIQIKQLKFCSLCQFNVSMYMYYIINKSS